MCGPVIGQDGRKQPDSHGEGSGMADGRERLTQPYRIFMETVISSGRIATVEDAILDPWSFIVTHSVLGWSLAYTDSDFSTLISGRDAGRVIKAQKTR